MKTYADDIFFELPGAWDNDSSYVYRREDQDIEVHLERVPVLPAATLDALLDADEARLKTLGPLQSVQRSDASFKGLVGRVLSVKMKGPSDKEASLMEVIVVKIATAVVVKITATAPAPKAAALAAARKEIERSLRLADMT